MFREALAVDVYRDYPIILTKTPNVTVASLGGMLSENLCNLPCVPPMLSLKIIA